MEDRILVILGYHSQELEWGKIVEAQFRKKSLEVGRNIHFLHITDSPILTGAESQHSNRKVFEGIKRLGNVKFLVDLHCHPFIGYTGKDPFFREYRTSLHDPSLCSNDAGLKTRFKQIFPMSFVGPSFNGDSRWKGMTFATFDPDFFGADSISQKEAYERGAPETVENLDKICMLFENRPISEINARYAKIR